MAEAVVWQMASAKLRPALAAGCCTFIIISSDMYSTVSRILDPGRCYYTRSLEQTNDRR